MMTRTRVAPALSLLLLAATAACSPPVQAPDVAARTAAHGERGGRLRETMRHLQELVDERKDAMKMTDAQRKEYLGDLINTAGAVVRAAEILVNSGPTRDLGPEPRQRFYELADGMYARAADVESRARQSNFMDMDTAYRGLEQACRNCHRLFRDR